MDFLALTPQEVADILKISKNTVYEIIKRGELNAYKVGNKVRVDMKDIEEYKNKGRSIPSKNNNTTTEENYNNSNPKGFIICGQDIILDILSRYLEIQPKGIKALRSYIGSYNGLHALYMGKVTVATAHLWDSETNKYNITYVKKLLPGIPSVIIHLAIRKQGFYIKKGNPKNIKNWEDFKRKDITFINREKGSGTRVLLDEKLKIMGIDSETIKGYDHEGLSHLAVASVVSSGQADFGLGNEKVAMQVKDLEFIPLQNESYDMIIKKSSLKKIPFKTLIDILNSKEFKNEIIGLGGYDITNIGKITYA